MTSPGDSSVVYSKAGPVMHVVLGVGRRSSSRHCSRRCCACKQAKTIGYKLAQPLGRLVDRPTVIELSQETAKACGDWTEDTTSNECAPGSGEASACPQGKCRQGRSSNSTSPTLSRRSLEHASRASTPCPLLKIVVTHGRCS